MMRIVSYCFIIFLSSSLLAQSENFRSRSSFGPMIGGSYYIGDLNQYGHFKNTNLSGGLVYRYYINSRIELRANFLFGHVNAADADSDLPIFQSRNLSFQSDIWELAGGIEFNYLNYKLGDMKYFFTPYMFMEIGAFQINPQAEYNGELIDLQPLGTEGQGSSLNSQDPYALTQLVIPFGVGIKLNVTKRMAISLEYGMRKTFTDYLDDVSGSYVNFDALLLENGNLSAQMADRSLGEGRAYGSRGNSSTKDWYSMFGAMITFSLGKPGKCFYH